MSNVDYEKMFNDIAKDMANIKSDLSDLAGPNPNLTSTTDSLINQANLNDVGTADAIKQLQQKKTAYITALFRGATDVSEDVLELVKKGMRALKDDNQTMLSQFEVIRTAYGDMQDRQGDYETSAGSAVRRLNLISDAYYDTTMQINGARVSTDSFFKDNLGLQRNYIRGHFTQVEAINATERAIEGLNERFAHQIIHMDDITAAKLPAYADGMGIAHENIQNVLEVQMLRTGEMSTNMLDEVAAFSKAVSRETGISMNYLNQATTDIIGNIKLFGDIQAEEATRIAANITQLGFKYDALSETQQKFGKFSSAADNIGKISQITGVQLDAQRISFLSAMGKQDEALLYMKEQFKRQGFDKSDFEGMVLPLRNALGDAMIGGQKGIMTLLDESREIKDIGKITAEVDTDEGFKDVVDNLDRVKMAFRSQEEMAKDFRIRGIRRMKDDVGDLAEQMLTFNSTITSFTIPGEDMIQAASKSAINALSSTIEGINNPETVKNAQELFGAMNLAFGGFTTQMGKIGMATTGLGGMKTDLDKESKGFLRNISGNTKPKAHDSKERRDKIEKRAQDERVDSQTRTQGIKDMADHMKENANKPLEATINNNNEMTVLLDGEKIYQNVTKHRSKDGSTIVTRKDTVEQ